MVDSLKIHTKINSLKQSHKRLSDLKNLPRETFLDNFIYFDSAKYNLITSIEAMIDICNHIISRKNLEVPATSADSVKILVKNKILESEYENIFVSMVKFRNKAVHLYSEIKDSEVYEILQNHLDDFDKFIQSIVKYIS